MAAGIDDWMHPPSTGTSWGDERKSDDKYLIVRERLVVCSHYGPVPTEWLIWRSFKTRDERDAELSTLREREGWRLRPAIRSDAIRGRWKFEDEEADLLMRLMALREIKRTDR